MVDEAAQVERRTFGCSACGVELTWTLTRAQWQAILDAEESCASCGGRLYVSEPITRS